MLSKTTHMLQERLDKIFLYLQFPDILSKIAATNENYLLHKSDQAMRFKLYHKSAYHYFYKENGHQFDSEGNMIIEDVDRQTDELKKELLRIDGQGTFKEAPSQWEGRPVVISQHRQKIQENLKTEMQIHYLPWQGLIMRILSVGPWAQLTFYSSTKPFEQKEIRHNIRFDGRISIVNDLRDDKYKTADDVYLVKHEGVDLKVVRMTLDASASKYRSQFLTSCRL